MPPRPAVVARRTTLGASLAGLVVLGGCDLDDLDPRSDPDPAEPVTSAPPKDADADLVASVVTDLTAALAAALAVRPARAAGRPFARLHRRHLAELDETEPASTGSPEMSAAALLGQERRLQRRLADAAVTAESGELAATLGSMSAAVAQLLATLPTRDAS